MLGSGHDTTGGGGSSTHLERKLLESDGQTGERLVSSTGLGYDGETSDGAVVVPRGNLDTGDVGRLVRSRGGRRRVGGGGGEATLGELCSLAAEDRLASPRESRSGDHGERVMLSSIDTSRVCDGHD